jgi:thiol-disulfide isomerase/thioredoxin
VLLYFFAEWCGDCKAQSDSLGRVWQKYKDRGLEMIAVTRLYGGPPGKPITPADEQAKLDNVWKETYSALDGVPVVVNTDTMIRYGVSATPTFALVDRKGKIRLYTPTRLSEAALSQAVEEVLAQ